MYIHIYIYAYVYIYICIYQYVYIYIGFREFQEHDKQTCDCSIRFRVLAELGFFSFQIVAAAVQQDVHCLRQADKSLQDDKELGESPHDRGDL